jgi:hypothetical protein
VQNTPNSLFWAQTHQILHGNLHIPSYFFHGPVKNLHMSRGISQILAENLLTPCGNFALACEQGKGAGEKPTAADRVRDGRLPALLLGGHQFFPIPKNRLFSSPATSMNLG